MYCKKCYEMVKEGWKYCPKCKANLQNGNIEIDKEVIIQKQKEENKLAFICICIFIISLIGVFTIKEIRKVFFCIALFSITTGYIKCQNNKFIKILFWLFVIGVILFILYIVFMVFFCLQLISEL